MTLHLLDTILLIGVFLAFITFAPMVKSWEELEKKALKMSLLSQTHISTPMEGADQQDDLRLTPLDFIWFCMVMVMSRKLLMIGSSM